MRQDQKRIKPSITENHKEFGFNPSNFPEIPDAKDSTTTMFSVEYNEESHLEKLMTRLAFTSCPQTEEENSSADEVT